MILLTWAYCTGCCKQIIGDGCSKDITNCGAIQLQFKLLFSLMLFLNLSLTVSYEEQSSYYIDCLVDISFID